MLRSGLILSAFIPLYVLGPGDAAGDEVSGGVLRLPASWFQLQKDLLEGSGRDAVQGKSSQYLTT